MRQSKSLRFISTLALLLFIVTISVNAVAPSKEVIAKWKEDGTYSINMKILSNFKAMGGCSPVEQPQINKERGLLSAAETVDTVNVLVLMVDFIDFQYTDGDVAGTAADFDSILFSDRRVDAITNPTGSMTDFYIENSYGKFYVRGEIFGWYTMNHLYSFYTDSSAYGLGYAYPNARDLANDAIKFADADTNVDFSRYDYNNDGRCDGVIIIHAGPGGEKTGKSFDIWSHNWTIREEREIDGVVVSNYNMNPEEYYNYNGSKLSPIGVFCHEYGHFLGLPDLYDTSDSTGTSQGLGSWSLMASGNYLNKSRTPAHFDAWCKIELGFVQPIEITENLVQAEIPEIENNPVVYKLKNNFSGQYQYWLVENRRKTGFDQYLPGEGLLVYHVDEQQFNNDDPTRYKVALEQADGFNSLALGGSSGDVNDPFPGGLNKREFHQFTTPDSRIYEGLATRIGLWDISDSDSLMYSDFDISFSRPWITNVGADSLFFEETIGNDNGIFEGGETIRFYFKIKNLMKVSYNVEATLSFASSNVDFTSNNINIEKMLNFKEFNNASYPIEFVIPDTIMPIIDSFFITIKTDSSFSGLPGGDNYTVAFGSEIQLGAPTLIIVDDDGGESFEIDYINAVNYNKVPCDTWDVNINGVPTYADLAKYEIVFWHTGSKQPDNIDLNDIATMRDLMDNGKNLCLSSANGALNMNDLDSVFMADYFKASYDIDLKNAKQFGAPGNEITDGFIFMWDGDLYFQNRPTNIMNIEGAGQPILYTKTYVYIDANISGISYSGSYKSIIITAPIEYIDDNFNSVFNTKADFIGKIIKFFGGITTSVYDGTQLTQLPNSFDLNQNYPNPFNPTTTISYTVRAYEPLGNKIPVTNLTIYNVLGEKVKILVNETQIPGTYFIEWDGTNSSKNKVASGIYFYRLTRANDAETKKMILLK